MPHHGHGLEELALGVGLAGRIDAEEEAGAAAGAGKNPPIDEGGFESKGEEE